MIRHDAKKGRRDGHVVAWCDDGTTFFPRTRASTKRGMRSEELSVLGTPLRRCSGRNMPTTGFTRDGVCSAHRGDAGSHHVCLRDIGKRDGAGHRGNFCDLTGQSDWCGTKRDWCVCEWAFERAVERAGCDAFDVKCDATNGRALDHYERAGVAHAAHCIRSQCNLGGPATASHAQAFIPQHTRKSE